MDEIYGLIFDDSHKEQGFELDFSGIQSQSQTSSELANDLRAEPESDNEMENDLNIGNTVNTWIRDENTDNTDWLPEFNRLNVPKTVIPVEPIKIFDIFLDNEMLTSILEFTNIQMSKQTKDIEQIDTTELRKFIGIQILMGLNRRDDEYDHWSSDELLTTDAIRRTMSRDRYHIVAYIYCIIVLIV